MVRQAPVSGMIPCHRIRVINLGEICSRRFFFRNGVELGDNTLLDMIHYPLKGLCWLQLPILVVGSTGFLVSNWQASKWLQRSLGRPLQLSSCFKPLSWNQRLSLLTMFSGRCNGRSRVWVMCLLSASKIALVCSLIPASCQEVAEALTEIQDAKPKGLQQRNGDGTSKDHQNQVESGHWWNNSAPAKSQLEK